MNTNLCDVIKMSEEFLVHNNSTEVKDHLLSLYSIRLASLVDAYLSNRTEENKIQMQSLFHQALSLRNHGSSSGHLAILAIGAFLAIVKGDRTIASKILRSIREAIDHAGWSALGQILGQFQRICQAFPHDQDLKEILGLLTVKYGEGLASQALQDFDSDKINTAIETLERGLCSIPQELSRRTIESRFRLATLFTNQGNLGKSLEWAQKAIQCQEQVASKQELAKEQIRFFQTRSATLTNIGQLVNEMEFFHKGRLIGDIPNYRSVLLAPYHHVVNKSILSYWRDHSLAITSKSLCDRLSSLGEKLELDTFYYKLPDGKLDFQWRGMISLQKRWDTEKRGPLLHLKRIHRNRGEVALKELGVPENAWWVALHVRDMSQGKFGKSVLSKPTSNRDADIFTYQRAIKAITDRGGWVIRLGDQSMKKMVEMERFIDYPHTKARAPWLDIYIAGAARFFMGTASGMCGVPMNFGVPLLMTNTAPTMSLPVGKQDRFVIKLLRERATGRYLSFSELFSPPYDLCYNVAIYEKNGIEIVHNTDDELEHAAIEMMSDLSAPPDLNVEATDARRFNQIIESCQPCSIQSRISSYFLNKHRELIDSPRPVSSLRNTSVVSSLEIGAGSIAKETLPKGVVPENTLKPLQLLD